MTKKCFLFICEGKTDRDVLIPVLEQEFKNTNFIFEVYHGDFITQYKNEIDYSNILSKINQYIKEKIREKNMQKKLRAKDYEGVVYVTDSDNCFLEDKPARLLKRNCILKLFNKKHITFNKIDIPFSLIIYAQNLEHVLFGEVILDPHKKASMNREYLLKVMDDPNVFLQTLQNPDLNTFSNNKDFLEFIKISSEPATNINIFFHKKTPTK